jgi:SnoaL-like domain
VQQVSRIAKQNVELLQRLFELFSERDVDVDAVLELVGPDVVWEVRSDIPDAGIYRGHEGFRRLHASFDVVDETWYRPLEYITTGNQVVVPLRWGGLGSGSRASFTARGGDVGIHTARRQDPARQGIRDQGRGARSRGAAEVERAHCAARATTPAAKAVPSSFTATRSIANPASSSMSPTSVPCWRGWSGAVHPGAWLNR